MNRILVLVLSLCFSCSVSGAVIVSLAGDKDSFGTGKPDGSTVSVLEITAPGCEDGTFDQWGASLHSWTHAFGVPAGVVVARMLVGESQHAPTGIDHAFGLRQGRHEMLVRPLAHRPQDRRAVGEVRVDAGCRGLGAPRHVADGDGLVAILAPQRMGGLDDAERQGGIGLAGHVDSYLHSV